MILLGFPGIGKTSYVLNNNFISVYDHDSSFYRKKVDWQIAYVSKFIELAKAYDLILMSTHKCVRLELQSREIPYILAYPNKNRKEDYLKIYRQRGNRNDFLVQLQKNWDVYIDELENDEFATKKIIIEKGKYLADYHDVLKEFVL